MPIICLLQENGPQKKAWKNEEGRGRKKEKHERRKQFETVAVADRRGRMGRERETVSRSVSWETTGRIESPPAVQVGRNNKNGTGPLREQSKGIGF